MTKATQTAFQGERGAFSEDAGRRFFGAAAESVPCHDFDKLFAAVAEAKADAAVVPIENTLAGSIIKNYDLLLEHDVLIVGEVVVRIVHNLIGIPGAQLGNIHRAYSHPVALAQCERFLEQHPAIEAVTAYDTAGSVKMIMEAGKGDQAAIASESAARVWGAEILVPGIESHQQNFTRFVIVTRPDRAAELARFGRGGEAKTSIVFRIGHRPGGLVAALAAFSDAGVNLTKIESRPIPGSPWEYVFYLDFLGDPGEPKVGAAMASLRAQAESVRVLGTFPRAEAP